MIQQMVQGVPFAAGGALFGITLCWGWGRLKQRLLWLEERREAKRRERQAEEFESCAVVIRERNPSVRVERYSVPASCLQSLLPAAAGQKGAPEVSSTKAVGLRVTAPPPRSPAARGISTPRELAEDHDETCHLIRVLEEVLVPEDEDGTARKPVITYEREPRPAPRRSETRSLRGAAPSAARATAPIGARCADESAVRRVPAVWLQDRAQGVECEEFTSLHVRSGDVEEVASPRAHEHARGGADRPVHPDASEAETCVHELLSTFEVRRRLAELRGEA